MDYLAYLPDSSFFSGLLAPAVLVSLFTLIVMELVLGIDNLVFVSIISNRVAGAKRAVARTVGLLLALVMRIGLLFTLSWIVSLTEPVVTFMERAYSWKDAILLGGGLFLIAKAALEFHEHSDPDSYKATAASSAGLSLISAILQIFILNIVFSLDSIITAVGMTDSVTVMIIAVVVSCVLMMIAAGPLGRFIERTPSLITLALGFLMVIGFTLVMDGLGQHIPKGYIYSMMGFAAFITTMNLLRIRARNKAHAAGYLQGTMAQQAAHEVLDEVLEPVKEQPDNFAENLLAVKGTVPADVDLEFPGKPA